MEKGLALVRTFFNVLGKPSGYGCMLGFCYPFPMIE